MEKEDGGGRVWWWLSRGVQRQWRHVGERATGMTKATRVDDHWLARDGDGYRASVTASGRCSDWETTPRRFKVRPGGSDSVPGVLIVRICPEVLFVSGGSVLIALPGGPVGDSVQSCCSGGFDSVVPFRWFRFREIRLHPDFLHPDLRVWRKLKQSDEVGRIPAKLPEFRR